MPLLAAIALALALPARQDPGPTPEQVRGAVEALQTAFESGTPADRVAAIREHVRVDVPAVVRVVAKGLTDRSGEVRLEAIEALGRSETDVSLDALIQHYRNERKQLRIEERVLPRLLVAIARHGDARAIGVLTDDVKAQMLRPTLRARILGLANVRTKESVEALFSLLDTIGFVEMHNHTEDFRLALLMLSGVDHGRSSDTWKSWWQANRETFEVPAKAPKLDQADAARWTDFWGSAHGTDGR